MLIGLLNQIMIKVLKTDFDAITNTVEQQCTEISQAKDKRLKTEKACVENIK